MKLTLRDTPVLTVWDTYQLGGITLRLVSSFTEEPYATATVRTSDTEYLPPYSAFIKDYSENAGMVAALSRAGIIEGAPVAEHSSGFVKIFAYRFTAEAIAELIEQTQENQNG